MNKTINRAPLLIPVPAVASITNSSAGVDYTALCCQYVVARDWVGQVRFDMHRCGWVAHPVLITTRN
jgi:hypothetical protein